MKRNILLAAFAAIMLALVMPAQAQQYTVTSVLAGGTNNVGVAHTNSYASSTYVFPGVAGYKEVAIYIGAKSTSATNTDNVNVKFDYSIDGTLYSTINLLSIPLTLNGTTIAAVVTNITMGSKGYIRLNSIGNTNADDCVTNIVIKCATKPGN